ncbi:39S ribosomal protein L52, mitochondrial isoform d [Pimephales promelas]|nr:39S ribosomal protein L52, mitochondrial isoform d [Pimephales promelas]
MQSTIRSFSSTCVSHAGKKWRLENGLARTGSEYGPITDLPDWSFADGRPAPPLKGQIRRQKQREDFARRAVYLNAEVDEGMKKWCERKNEIQMFYEVQEEREQRTGRVEKGQTMRNTYAESKLQATVQATSCSPAQRVCGRLCTFSLAIRTPSPPNMTRALPHNHNESQTSCP